MITIEYINRVTDHVREQTPRVISYRRAGYSVERIAELFTLPEGCVRSILREHAA